MSDGAGQPLPADASIIDTHVHIWSRDAAWMSWLAQRPDSWDVVRRDFTWDELSRLLDGAGVGRAILVQAAPSVQESQLLLDLAAAHDRIQGVVGWVTLADPAETESGLDALTRTPGLLGIRALYRWEQDGIFSRPVGVQSCRLIADRGLPLDLFLNSHTDLPQAIALAEKVPADMRLVIDHLGRPPIGVAGSFDDWSESMRILSTFPNVFVKYSGWATMIKRVRAADVRPYIESTVEQFGARRVMYASNWPVALVAGGYQDTFEASLDAIESMPQADRAAVLWQTAERCYLERF